MRHVPHVLIAREWPPDRLVLSESAERHIAKVLRFRGGETVSYTDGAGRLGSGTYDAGTVVRGDERSIDPSQPEIVLAVAPPRSADRARFLVEKAAELAVAEIRWLRSRHGEGRTPSPDKVHAWSVAALEQSRGAWLTQLGDPLDLNGVARLEAAATLIAHPGGASVSDALQGERGGRIVLVVGPEGGFADDEIPAEMTCVGLGERILRVETAALAAVASIRLL